MFWRSSSNGSNSEFPSAFGSYSLPSEKVYGAICVSPENKILLVRGRNSGLWSFPKGHQKPNEPCFHCAVRELYEETGISVDMNEINPCNLPYKRFKIGRYFVLDFNEEVSPSPRDWNEISEARWVTQDELTNFINNKEVNVDVRRFGDFMETNSPKSSSQECGDVVMN